MDQFGVLVESIGFKAQGRSAPLADLKGKTTSTATTTADPFPPSFGKPSTKSSSFTANFDDLDGIFRSNTTSANNDFDDIFGGTNVNKTPVASGAGINGGSMFDFDSVFKGSNNLDNDDIFGGIPGSKSYGSNNVDDMLFGGMPNKKSDPVDDLFASFGGMGLKSNGSSKNYSGKKQQESGFKSDDLIPGFGGSTPSSNGAKSETRSPQQSNRNPAKSFATPVEDPFVMLERTQGKAGGRSGASEFNDLDSFFGSVKQSTAVPSQKSTNEDLVFDALFHNAKGPKVEAKPSANYNSKKKAALTKNTSDDFSYLFGMGAAPSSGEFQEVEGESEERRRARLNHHIRTQERMAKVLNEKNQRDLQTQQEQEERHRLAETLDDDIKRWAAGKEGNLRALLSSLQHVLWPECGWQSVSLTDLITSTSVKKVYYKATLCVHPDKVQQKGFNLEQKYTAEKVFDILKERINLVILPPSQNECPKFALGVFGHSFWDRGSNKEAWNKFNAEEFKKR